VCPFGYEVVRLSKKIDPDILSDEDFLRRLKVCQPFTMTPVERMYGLYQTAKYAVTRDVPGYIGECGICAYMTRSKA
jgi:hypothetical protein